MPKPLKIFLFCLLGLFAAGLVGGAGFYFYYYTAKIEPQNLDSINDLEKKNGIIWGVNFSQSHAEYLDLDWKKTYSAIIDDLGVKNIKLHTNWSWIEIKKGDFYFNDTDWQIKKAEDNDVKLIYVLGMKTGRWPECHMPNWTQNASEEEISSELLKYITQVVERYRDSRAIAYWQVENEPFFKFGVCPTWYYKSNALLEAEINLVKTLDPSRKIIVSESGELSGWSGAAKSGDIIGTTIYRSAWSKAADIFGINLYSFLNPNFYNKKAQIIKEKFNKDVVCIELQAEPWASSPIKDASLQEQAESMNLKTFKENVEFAKKTGLNAFYFWGVEWWYQMKTQYNQPEIWNEAKKIFQ